MRYSVLVLGSFLLGVPLSMSSAAAQERDAPSVEPGSQGPLPSAATETPAVAYAHSAFGVSAGTVGAAGYGESRGEFRSSTPNFGGGLRIWISPLDRLTLFADAERRDEGSNRRFAPSASAQLRIVGDRKVGWALSALARYKAEGFAELGGEVEFAVLGSYARRGLHLDGNVIVGAGFEEGESDGELLARAGYDVLPFLRIGGEGRARQRLSGDASLPGGRSWDAYAGPQVLGYSGAFFGALTAGPSTVGIQGGLGWLALLTVGGAAF